MLRQRRVIQESRVVSDRDLESILIS